MNTALNELLEQVVNTSDPWLLFLYVQYSTLCLSILNPFRKALFLSRLSRREEAIESALLSIAGFPWNWSAWTLLASCIGDGEEVLAKLVSISIPLIHHTALFPSSVRPSTINPSISSDLSSQDTQRITQPFRARA